MIADGTQDAEGSGGDARSAARCGRAGVPRERRGACDALGSCCRRWCHPRRGLLALPRQGRAVRGDVRAGGDADGDDARRRGRRPSAAIRSARCAGWPCSASRVSRAIRARRPCSTSSSTSANSRPTWRPSRSRQRAADDDCGRQVIALIEEAIALRPACLPTAIRELAAQLMKSFMIGVMHEWVQNPQSYDLARAAPGVRRCAARGARGEPAAANRRAGAPARTPRRAQRDSALHSAVVGDAGPARAPIIGLSHVPFTPRGEFHEHDPSSRRHRRRNHGQRHRAGERRAADFMSSWSTSTRPPSCAGSSTVDLEPRSPAQEGQDHRRRQGRGARAHQGHHRLRRPQGLRLHHRGRDRERGAQAPDPEAGRRDREARGDPRVEHVVDLDHRGSPPLSRARIASSACTSSTRCR